MKLDEALTPQLARLRAAWMATPLPAFFAWWGHDLRACLPARARALFEDHVETLLVDSSADELALYRASRPGAAAEVRVPATRSVEERRLAINEARAALEDPRVRMQLCLPRAKILRRTLHLPAAAEHNLVQVLGFEMDRQTPFKMSQVYLDQRIVARDAEKRTLQVDLAVVPRAVLDAELERLKPLELALDGIDAWADAPGGERMGFNFLPRARRVTRRNKRLWLNLGLALAALLLLLLSMSLWVDNREQALQAMQTEVTALQRQAGQVTTLRKGLVDSIDGASFLMRKKRHTPLRLQLLQDITHALGDDTYLQRLQLDTNDRLSLQGLSDHAAALLSEVKKIPGLADASFQGVIQPDPRLGKERFNILATVVEGEPATTAADADAALSGTTSGEEEDADARAETSS